MNISGFINRDVHPQNFHLSISIVKKHTFYCVSNKLLYFCKRKELFDKFLISVIMMALSAFTVNYL